MAGITQREREHRDRLYDRGLKQCNRCDEPQPLASFHTRADGYKGLAGCCRRCKNTATGEYQRQHPEKYSARAMRWRHANRAAWLEISRRRDIRNRWKQDGRVVV